MPLAILNNIRFIRLFSYYKDTHYILTTRTQLTLMAFIPCLLETQLPLQVEAPPSMLMMRSKLHKLFSDKMMEEMCSCHSQSHTKWKQHQMLDQETQPRVTITNGKRLRLQLWFLLMILHSSNR